MDNKPRSTKPWKLLLVLPFILLCINSIVQLLARFFIARRPDAEPHALVTIINIFSLIVGIASVLMLLGIPIWIIMLIVTASHNNKVRQLRASQLEKPSQTDDVQQVETKTQPFAPATTEHQDEPGTAPLLPKK